MDNYTYPLLRAQDHPWMAAQHGRRDALWAPSVGTLTSRLTGVPEASTPGNHRYRQSAHAGIPIVPEERAMPVVAHSLAPPQRSPRAVLVLLLFRFIPATQLVLILVFFKKPIGSWELIVDVMHLFFSNMLLL